MTARGDLWVWGKAGLLGTGDDDGTAAAASESATTGRGADLLPLPSPVVQISAGDQHALALLADGRVATWGTGLLGGDSELKQAFGPLQLVVPLPVPVARVVCGHSHSVVLGAGGEVYTWGSGFFGRLGHGDTRNVAFPTRVGTLSGQRIVDAAAGGCHTLLRADNGTVYAMGYNKYGQLGVGDCTDRTVPVVVTALDPTAPGTAVVSLAAGAKHSLAVTRTETLLTWGANGNGQLGLGRNVKSDVIKPQAVDLFGRSVVGADAGYVHTAVLTGDGQVWTFGCGDDGRLGFSGSNKDQMVPRVVEGLAALLGDCAVASVHCGGAFTAVRGSNGRIATWGWTKYWNLGFACDAGHISQPRVMPEFGEVSEIACGNYVSMVALYGDPVRLYQHAVDGRIDAVRSLANGAALDHVCAATGLTALAAAVRAGHAEICELLLSRGAGAEPIDPSGRTPIMVACAQGDAACIRALLAADDPVDVNRVDEEGATCLHHVMRSGRTAALEALLARDDLDVTVCDEVAGMNPLHVGLANGHPGLVANLIARGLARTAAALEAADMAGKTPLDHCSPSEAFAVKRSAGLFDVYVCFSDIDAPFVDKLAAAAAEGYIRLRVRPADTTDDEIDEAAIAVCKVILFVITSSSVRNPRCRRELEYAKSRGVSIMSVWFEKVGFDAALEALIFRHQLLDFSVADTFAERMQSLITGFWHEFAQRRARAAAGYAVGGDGSGAHADDDAVRQAAATRYVYLCGSDDDAGRVAALRDLLEAADVPCRDDSSERSLAKQTRAITRCMLFLFVVSADAVARSSRIRDQLALAENHGRSILVVSLERTVPIDASLAYTLSRSPVLFFVPGNEAPCAQQVRTTLTLASEIEARNADLSRKKQALDALRETLDATKVRLEDLEEQFREQVAMK